MAWDVIRDTGYVIAPCHETGYEHQAKDIPVEIDTFNEKG